MHYRLHHSTRYDYSAEVALSHNEARLLPRELPWQRVGKTELAIHPQPMRLRERRDFFGNRVAYFSIQELHGSLEVTTTSLVTVSARPLPEPGHHQPWEQAATCLRQGTDCLEARLFMLDSDFVGADQALADYARASFTPGRALVEAVYALNQQIFTEFTYDPEHTTIATPLLDVLASRRGVCQDFAHLAIGCLRSLGLAARYVSGYMETLPPPGQPKLQGADATHAWLAVFIPGWGWLEIDPTNGCLPDERYIILGWGRDFSDVTPLKGVMSGGGNDRLTVAVDVIPLAEGEAV
ncbi:transglutaminase [Zobellella denitrificans]|jgi:transglutaminase-like putative cysteine protease|uniref:Transglutaminase n=1 Tax=Zobellella denitrificans TaxID=347534 RepID=A0A231MXM3_9GAMM|nr:transglutaminase family protein [Zobellella denitrificans]ATG74216.1 transglutaminase [Zobellella denitrificans]OXS14993.1 transglutaminase [Zobellella denitrificans]